MTKSYQISGFKLVGRGQNETGETFAILTIYEAGVELQHAVPESLLLDEPRKVAQWLLKKTKRMVSTDIVRGLREQAIENSKTRPKYEVLTRTGWNRRRNAFLKPNGLIAAPGVMRQNIVTCLDETADASDYSFVPRGDLEAWQRIVVQFAKGNPRAILALCISFAGPILPLLNEEHFIVAFVGKGGTGKTSLGALASLAWGAHRDLEKARARGCGLTAKATINEMDNFYAVNSNMLLFLDEFSSFMPGKARSSEALPDFIQAHALGHRRARLTDSGPRKSWLTIVLLTSNEPLHQLCPHLDDMRRDAVIDRYVEVPGVGKDQSFIEALNGERNLETFIGKMKDAAIACAGVAAERLVRHLVMHLRKDRSVVENSLRRKVAEFQREVRHIRVNARRKRRFAVLYAAGFAAQKAGVLPLAEAEIKDALVSALRAHVEFTTPTASEIPLEALDVARALARYWHAHRKSVLPLRPNAAPQKGPAGFENRTKSGDVEWLLPGQVFDAVLGGVSKSVTARNLLAQHSLIATERHGKERRMVKRRKLATLSDGTPHRESVTTIFIDRLLRFASKQSA